MSSIFSIFKDSTKSFEGQEPGERVVLLMRRHPVVVYMRIALMCVALALPVFVGVVMQPALEAEGLLTLFYFLSGIWALAFWMLIFHSLTMYALNVVVVTDKRIMESSQHGLFNRQISELHMTRVQDVSVHTKGMLETFLKYGDLVVQTAAAERQFTFEEIPNPEHAKDTIMKIVAARHSGVQTV